jgi:hypothetical protein
MGATRASLRLTRANCRRAEPWTHAYRIVVESERAAQPGRAGVIEEILTQNPPRFRVRWEDGRTSILAPAAGVARIERRKREHAKALTDAESTRR